MTNLGSADGAVLHLPADSRRRSQPTTGSPPVVVLLLHGGIGDPDHRPVPPWWPPVLRMTALGAALRGGVHRHCRTGTAIARLRYRARGWNAGGAEPVADARWAITQLRRRYPGSPIVIVGHSMGGRVGALVLSECGVIGLVGLAAWLPPGAPVPAPGRRRIVLLHGSADREIPSGWSREWSVRAPAGATDRTTFLELPGAGHGMVRQWRRWHRRTARAVATIVAEQARPG